MKHLLFILLGFVLCYSNVYAAEPDRAATNTTEAVKPIPEPPFTLIELLQVQARLGILYGLPTSWIKYPGDDQLVCEEQVEFAWYDSFIKQVYKVNITELSGSIEKINHFYSVHVFKVDTISGDTSLAYTSINDKLMIRDGEFLMTNANDYLLQDSCYYWELTLHFDDQADSLFRDTTISTVNHLQEVVSSSPFYAEVVPAYFSADQIYTLLEGTGYAILWDLNEVFDLNRESVDNTNFKRCVCGTAPWADDLPGTRCNDTP